MINKYKYRECTALVNGSIIRHLKKQSISIWCGIPGIPGSLMTLEKAPQLMPASPQSIGSHGKFPPVPARRLQAEQQVTRCPKSWSNNFSSDWRYIHSSFPNPTFSYATKFFYVITMQWWLGSFKQCRYHSYIICILSWSWSWWSWWS